MLNSFEGKIIEICISDKKGTKKVPVGDCIVRKNYGIIGDVHASISTNRQISLLSIESIRKMNKDGFDFKPGDFAENLTTKGIDLSALSIGTRLLVGKEVELEVTQIGKKCHSQCEIKRKTGYCIMSKEGIFTRVIKGGYIKKGFTIKTLNFK